MLTDIQAPTLSKKYKVIYTWLLFICLAVMCVSAIVDTSGRMLFITYIVSVFIMLALTRSYVNVLFMSSAMLLNSVLADGSFMFLSIRRVLFVFTVVLLLIVLLKFNNRKFTVPGTFYLCWFAYLVIDDVFVHQRNLISLLTIALLFSISYVLQAYASRSRKNAEKVLLSISVGLFFIAIVAYIELILGHTFFYSQWVGNERYRNGVIRVGSTVSDPNNVCLMMIPFLFLLETEAMKSLIKNRLRRSIILFILILVFLTSSRVGLVALIVGIAVYFLIKRKVYFLIGIPIVGGLSNFLLSRLDTLLSQYQESTSFRKYVIELAMLAWSSNPLMGSGGDAVSKVLNFGGSDNLYNTMNTYVYMLMCYGIVGLIFFIGFFAFLLKDDIIQWVKKRTLNRDTVLKISCIASLAVIIFTLDTFYIALMWVLPAFFTAMKFFSDKKE